MGGAQRLLIRGDSIPNSCAASPTRVLAPSHQVCEATKPHMHGCPGIETNTMRAESIGREL